MRIIINWETGFNNLVFKRLIWLYCAIIIYYYNKYNIKLIIKIFSKWSIMSIIELTTKGSLDDELINNSSKNIFFI